MAPFSALSEIDKELLDPTDEEDEAEIETWDPAQLQAMKDAIAQVVGTCTDLYDIVSTAEEANNVDALPGKPLPCKLTPGMLTLAAGLLPKIKGIAKTLRYGTNAKLEWNTICTNSGREAISVRRSVETRWNTAIAMIDDILSMEDEIKRLVAVPNLDLQKYTMCSEEWTMTRSLQPLLRAFLALTLKFSQSNVPLISEVIPMMDQLTTGIDHLRASHKIHPMVRYAAALTQQMVNKLYSKSDESWIYRVAIGEWT